MRSHDQQGGESEELDPARSNAEGKRDRNERDQNSAPERDAPAESLGTKATTRQEQ